VLVLSGLAAWGVPRRAAAWVGVTGAIVGSLVGLIPAIHVLADGTTVAAQAPWNLPLASFAIAIDPLSAFFLLPVFSLSALTAVYGFGYLKHHRGRGRAGTPWLWSNLLTASMAAVLVARNGILFLVAWEVMTVASYFLVTFEHERKQAREAGRIYLVAAHIGTAFLLVFFLKLAGPADTLDFNRFLQGGPGGIAGTLFFLMLVGFGVKAGFVPLHVWLPEAHPAAPPHVSALLSGAMLKMGIYGILRFLPYLGAPPSLWGWTLLGVGLGSALTGVLYSLAQRDLKRVLAYSSVENVGIIAVSLGLGLLGLTYDSPPIVVLGFGAALLHVLNHAAFKGLLFLGAGAAVQSAHTGDLEYLGGLLKRLPSTGWAFLLGAVAIAGLPPLNGFVSEFLLYLGAFRAVANLTPPAALAGACTIGGLGLVGGLAAATFARGFGIAFLGEPRTQAAHRAHDVAPSLRLPMLVLATACFVLAFASLWIVPALRPVLAVATGIPSAILAAEVASVGTTLISLTEVTAGFLLLLLALAGLRKLLLVRRAVATSITWDCGYAAASPRGGYTASSFAQPALQLFAPMLGTRVTNLDPLGPFPTEASLATATPDSFRERVFGPLGRELARQLARFRHIQEGRVQIYVLYIAVTLVALLLYEFARVR